MVSITSFIKCKEMLETGFDCPFSASDVFDFFKLACGVQMDFARLFEK